MPYLPRIMDTVLASKLKSSGGVIVEGPKASGKTATASLQARTIHYVDVEPEFSELVKLAPQAALSGNVPILIDEWQLVPEVWDYIRRAIDDRQKPGQFIMSGSATPADGIIKHSGLGRFAHLYLRPMTAWERGVFPGGVSLRALSQGNPIATQSVQAITVPDLLEQVVHGGWPADHAASWKEAQDHAKDYVNRLVSFEVPDVAGTTVRRPRAVRTLLHSIARNVATAPSISTLTADVRAQASTTDRSTVERWLEALERLFIVVRQPAWIPNLRSKAALRSSDVLHLADSSLTTQLLSATPEKLLGDLETAGLLFESFVIQQLQSFADPLDADVLHMRDSNGHELDAVIVLEDGNWIPVEVKLGGHRVQSGIQRLQQAIAQIDTGAVGKPVASVLIVGGINVAYQDPSGVTVVPIQALEP